MCKYVFHVSVRLCVCLRSYESMFVRVCARTCMSVRVCLPVGTQHVRGGGTAGWGFCTVAPGLVADCGVRTMKRDGPRPRFLARKTETALLDRWTGGRLGGKGH